MQQTRLLGSAADEGIAEAVFQIGRNGGPVVERLLEASLVEFEIRFETGPGASEGEVPIASI